MVNQWDGVGNIQCGFNATRWYIKYFTLKNSKHLNLSSFYILHSSYKNGSDVLDALDMHKSNYAIDFVAICLILVGVRIISFFVLFLKSFRR